MTEQQQNAYEQLVNAANACEEAGIKLVVKYFNDDVCREFAGFDTDRTPDGKLVVLMEGNDDEWIELQGE